MCGQTSRPWPENGAMKMKAGNGQWRPPQDPRTTASSEILLALIGNQVFKLLM